MDTQTARGSDLIAHSIRTSAPYAVAALGVTLVLDALARLPGLADLFGTINFGWGLVAPVLIAFPVTRALGKVLPDRTKGTALRIGLGVTTTLTIAWLMCSVIDTALFDRLLGPVPGAPEITVAFAVGAFVALIVFGLTIGLFLAFLGSFVALGRGAERGGVRSA